MSLVPTIKDNDWNSVRRAIQKLSGLKLGTGSIPTFAGLTLSGLTASRLISTDASKALSSVGNLTSWVAGTANEIDIADDGDGTITIGIVNPLIVTKGGTGLSTTTINQILYSSANDTIAGLATANSSILVTSAAGVPSFATDIPTAITVGGAYVYRAGGTDVAQADGGTGIDTSGVTDGQLLIGNTAGNVLALATLTGTANQVVVTNAASSITLSTPQDIHATASPTFSNLSLGTGELTCGSINRAAGTLTREVAGPTILGLTAAAATFYQTLIVGNGWISVGYDDYTRGVVTLFGGNGSDLGGSIFFGTDATHDDDIQNYYAMVDEDDFVIGDNSNGDIFKITGPGGGVSVSTSLAVVGGVTIATGIIIPDDGWIGSVTENNAIQIASDGDVTIPNFLYASSDVVVSGHILFPVNNSFIGCSDSSPTLTFNNTDDQVEMTGTAFVTTGYGKFGGGANTEQLIIKANAAQTNANPLIELQSSTGAKIGQIHTDHVYNIFIGADAGFSNVVGNPQGRRNIFIGYQAGTGNVSGYYNTCVGHNTGVALASGHHNTFIGYLAGEDCYASYCTFIGSNAGKEVTTGAGNGAIGDSALGLCTTGAYNFAMGANALAAVVAGDKNIGIGIDSGLNCTGSHNTFLGYRAGYTVAAINGSVMVGYEAGYHETAANKLFIDNVQRASEADGRIKALLYGVFDAAVANQSLRVNGLLTSSYGAKLGDGGTTNYVEIKTDGEINLHGTARVWGCEDLSPVAAKLPGADPPLEDTIDAFPFHRYDRGTEESVYFVWHVPCDYATGTVNVRGYFAFVVESPPTSGGTNVDETVVMGFEYKKISTGDVFSFAAGTTSGSVSDTIAVDETAWITHHTPYGVVDTTGFVPGDIILFRFFRDATNVADTYDNEAVGADNDVWVKTYHLEYLKDKLGTAT